MSAADFALPDPELDALVDRVENDPESIDADAWLIADLDRADRTLRRLAHMDAELADVDALYRLRRDELDAWRDAARARDLRVRVFLEARLEQFHRARLAADPRAKTLHLPSGESTSRKGQASWRYTDETAFVAWAQANGRNDLLRETVTPDRGAVKKAFTAKDGMAVTADGEVVPGLAVEPPERTFTPKPNPIGGAR